MAVSLPPITEKETLAREQFDRAAENAPRGPQITSLRNAVYAIAKPHPPHPHSSRLIPPEERARLAPDDRTLALELLRMTDTFTDDLFAPTPIEAARVVFPISRLVCDVERFSDDADEPMASKGMGAVYVRTSNGRPLREHLTLAQRTRLMETWYRPHHQKLTQTVDVAIADGKNCIIVDCHSFSSRPLPHEPDQDPVRPDICIGTDNWHTAARLRDELVAAASAGGFSVLVGRPFAGDETSATVKPSHSKGSLLGSDAISVQLHSILRR